MTTWVFDDNHLGMLPLNAIDAGFTPPNQSTLIPTPPNVLGMEARAFDPVTYGEGLFILLAGVASTVVGSVVRYNSTTFLTALIEASASNVTQPGEAVAVAMSANAAATTFGWYQIKGYCPAVTKGATAAAGVYLFTSSVAGALNTTTVSGTQVIGMRTLSSVNSTSTTNDVVAVMLDHPRIQPKGGTAA